MISSTIYYKMKALFLDINAILNQICLQYCDNR